MNFMDTDLYNPANKFEGYSQSISVREEESVRNQEIRKKRSSYTAPESILKELQKSEEEKPDYLLPSNLINDDYKNHRFNRGALSPDRNDAFAMGDKTPQESVRTYSDVMKDEIISNSKKEILREIAKKKEEKNSEKKELKFISKHEKLDADYKDVKKRKNCWDDGDEIPRVRVSDSNPRFSSSSWDETPVIVTIPNENEGCTPRKVKSRWDVTRVNSTRSVSTRSRWDVTPAMLMTTPSATPVGGINLLTPKLRRVSLNAAVAEQHILDGLSDDDLDAMLPSEGYMILERPRDYAPTRTPARKCIGTLTPLTGMTPQYRIPEENRVEKYDLPRELPEDLPYIRPEDYQYFERLFEKDEPMTVEEGKERKISRLLLKVKNGTPPQRKLAMRQLTNKAKEFGAQALFDQILPLLMSRTLEDQERHLLVKVIDRVLYKLDELVRPFVHKILVVVAPLLISEDYYLRVEGREIVSNLSKAVGLATMIAAMRPDIDSFDEYVRNTTARAFSVVGSTLGIPALLPFLRAVCQSKKSWQARHTGIKVVQQIGVLMGCAILPHLKGLVEIVKHGLEDEDRRVRTITALSISALAEAAAPYGIESIDSVLKPLWKGIRSMRGKVLAAFLKAIGFIIPLMDSVHASYYTGEVMVILIREFKSPDEEMKKIVLKVVKQCVSTEGVETEYIRAQILPEFFKNFWILKMALDRRNYRELVDTTVEIANKVGVVDIIGRLVSDLMDESEEYRNMVMETIDKVVSNLGASEIGTGLEELLIDGMLYAFQEQVSDKTNIMLNGFGSVVAALGNRVKPYLPQICGTIKWRLNTRSDVARQQAADLIAKIAIVMKECQEEQLLGHLGVVLYECLGEEFPEVLGSILGALKAIVNVIGMTKMTPPIKELLPRLAPILKNRHEKVQQNCIDLVGRIADRGSEFVPAHEWMRICFDLLDMLRAHRKGIQRAAVNSFGYIAKAIGPQDVLTTLLNNLKVQERQARVCTTVAIALLQKRVAHSLLYLLS